MPAEIPPPPIAPPLRLARPLPPYRYVPGQHPHPLKHPDGHSRQPEALSYAELWLRGCDLYAHRYYWEAHEAWEAAWKMVAEGSERQLLQALIQLAAATLKHHLGHARPASLLLDRASARIEAVVAAEGAVWRGLDLLATRASAARFVCEGGDWPVLVSP